MKTDAEILHEFSGLIQAKTGVQLGEKQRNMVESRIRKRACDLNLTGISGYYRYFLENLKTETGQLISLLTTHHSYFFREYAHFEFLESVALPELIPVIRGRADKTLRLWSTACSRGQEVYSLAMFLTQYFKRFAPDLNFEICGTDVDSESVQLAKNGVYHSREIKDVPLHFLGDHWARGTGEISDFLKAKRSLRDRVRFDTLNLIDPEGVQKLPCFDLIFCRNVFIYFSVEQIRAISQEILKKLLPKGYFLIGISETLHGLGLDLSTAGPSVYRHTKLKTPSRTNPISLPKLHEKRRTRVLIVDDSSTVRNLLTRILQADPEVEVVGTADRPSTARAMIEALRPDVITLDIHMPEMNGVQLLQEFLPGNPIPTIMISSISLEEGPLVLSALECGAVDYLQKPSFDQLKEVAPIILEKVKHARFSKVFGGQIAKAKPERQVSPKNQAFISSKAPLIAIGSSTGGTEALRRIFERLPSEIPPILVVQHIPAVFSKAFADRMNTLCPFEVLEAVDGMAVCPNRIIIAAGGTQMSIVRSGRSLAVKVDPHAPTTNRHKPSVDVLFNSVAEIVRHQAIGVILTGMGSDGAKGLLRMREKGAHTLGQDEATSVVYGMPRAAFELGAVERQLPIDTIADALVELCHSRLVAA